MDNYDDDEHSAAYDRAIYHEFANIVHHYYDDTARPAHDDIDFEPGDYDGAEFDNDGEPVTLYGVIIFNFGASGANIETFTDYDPYDDPYFYLYNRLRGIYKPSRDDNDDDKPSDSPDSGDDESEW